MLLAKDAYGVGLNGIAQISGPVAYLNGVEHLVYRKLLAGNAGEIGVGEGATKVFCGRRIGQLDGNFPGNAVTGSELGNWIDLEAVGEAIPTVSHKNVDAVLITQIPIAIGEGKGYDHGINPGDVIPALRNFRAVEVHKLNFRLNRVGWRIGATRPQQDQADQPDQDMEC